MFINVALQYIREHSVYIRETLQSIIREVIDTEDLDLECNPQIIYKNTIDQDEMRTGITTKYPKDVPFYQALNNPDTRAEYIRHLQVLQWWVEAFMTVITQSTRKLPYNIRYLARETLESLRVRDLISTPP
jgi:Ras GTPase-activating-like protein IQGAP2/3